MDWALFVDREHDGFVRRIEIKPSNLLNLLDKTFVVRQLESLPQVRLQAVRTPNPLHARVADTSRLGQPASAPVRCGRRLLMQGHVNHLLDHRRCEWRFVPPARPVPPPPRQSLWNKKVFPPLPPPPSFF